MATYDLTSKATPGVESNSIAALRSRHKQYPAEVVEAYLDISKLVAAGVTIATGDIFQVLEIPAPSVVLFAGAEVMTAFDGTTPTVDIDFAAGDDIVDGASVATTGLLASGTNGAANTPAGSTYAPLVSTTDTIDVTLTVTGNPTVGVLRVYACIAPISAFSTIVPTEVGRDQLA